MARRFLEIVEPHVWCDGLTDEDVREVRRMKARIERECLPAGDDPQFHLQLRRGSLSDVEFCAQLLQLQHGVRSPGTMSALDALESAGARSPEDRAVLAEAYRFCERTRNRPFLVRGSPGDALPSRPEHLTRLARSLGTGPHDFGSSTAAPPGAAGPWSSGSSTASRERPQRPRDAGGGGARRRSRDSPPCQGGGRMFG